MKKFMLVKTIAFLLEQEGLTMKEIYKELDVSSNDIPTMTLIVLLFKKGWHRENIAKKLCISLEKFDENIQEFFVKLPYGLDDLENKEVLMKKVSEFHLTKRTLNCFMAADVEYVWQLVSLQKDDLLKHRNFGAVSVIEVDRFMKESGLKFGTHFSQLELEILRSSRE